MISERNFKPPEVLVVEILVWSFMPLITPAKPGVE